MKKRLNETAVLNELRQGSVFFRDQSSPTEIPIKETKNKTAAGSQTKKVQRKTENKKEKQRKNKKYEKQKKGKNERAHVRTKERSNERLLTEKERIKIRHTFDIYQDQLRGLQRLQLKVVQEGKKKPTLGDMVQKALDQYLDNANQNR